MRGARTAGWWAKGAGVAAGTGVLALLLAARAQEAMAPAPGVQVPGDDAPSAQASAAQDPPSEVARVSVLLGNVSVEPASVNQFTPAEVNDALTTGDRIYADAGANAELESGVVAVRMGQQTDLTVTAMTDALEQLGLAQGSVHLRSYPQGDPSQTGVPPATIELDTPNVAVTVLEPGDVRVDVDPATDATTVTAVEGQVQVEGNGLQQTMQAGQRARFLGSDTVAAQWLYAVAPDGLDRFSGDRDAAYANGLAAEQEDVNPETIGAADLAGAGEWQTDADDQPIWYPTGVAVDWAPYSCGRWGWVAPWGWTWIDCAPWGFAPFHYGRWEYRGRRWGWLPGPPVAHPVYAPALVVFVGGPGMAVGGAGVTAWFPLGPREPYIPWYHASPVYQNRVNVANIYDRNANRVRMAYNQRSVSPGFASPGVYANRPVGTVAVAQAGFAAGRPVAQSLVRLGAGQMVAGQVLPHPLVTPERSMVAPVAASAVPVRIARPALNSRVEDERMSSGAVGGGQAAPVERQPAAARPEQAAPQDQRGAQPAQTDQPRTLYHRADPPPPRPSFEEQQRAIEGADPGRPLSPQQMQNLRQNQPVRPAEQREAPHPSPAPRPVPAAHAPPARSAKH